MPKKKEKIPLKAFLNGKMAPRNLIKKKDWDSPLDSNDLYLELVEIGTSNPKQIARLLAYSQFSHDFSESSKATTKPQIEKLSRNILENTDIDLIPDRENKEDFFSNLKLWYKNHKKEKNSAQVLGLALLSARCINSLDIRNPEIAEFLTRLPITTSITDSIGSHRMTPLDAMFALWLGGAAKDFPGIVLIPSIEWFNQIEKRNSQVAELKENVDSLENQIRSIREELSKAQESNVTLQNTIGDQDVKLREQHDSHAYRIDAMTSKIRSIADGRIYDWLRTALDASQVEPPRGPIIQERLEDSLKELERIREWLRDSD